MRLHEELREGRFPNCRRLGRELEVAPKTIQRDIDFMRDQLGLPLAYDAERYGYYYTEPVSAFPSVQVSEGELVALLVAQKALGQYRGTVFEKPLASAFRKLADSLPEEVSLASGSWEGLFSFKSLGAPVADLELFSLLSGAVRRCCGVRFEYRKLRGEAFEERRVRPYHLTCVDNQWYLFGFDEERAGLRTFALPRMKNLRADGPPFERPKDFSPSDYLSDSFGIFSGRGRQEVGVRFDSFAGRLVRERVWHRSQKLKDLRGGGLELSMTLGSLPEVERWVLSWGRHAQVLRPAALRESVAAAVAEMAATYGPGPLKAARRRKARGKG